MASQNINVGTNADDGTGESLRSAFIDIRKMFAEVYGQTYTSDTQDLGGTTLAFKADQLSLTNTAEAATDNYVLTYDDASGGFTLEEKFDGDITSIVAGDGLTGTSLDTDDATLNVEVDDSTIELSASDGTGVVQIKNGGVDTLQLAADAVDGTKIADDAVDHDQLANRYTRVQDISSTTSPIDLECDDYAVFNLSGNLGTVTLNLKDLKTGQAVDILLSGSDLSSAVITLDTNFSSETINKVGTNDIDTSKTNMIQVVCIDDTTSDAIINYAVAEYAADSTPNA